MTGKMSSATDKFLLPGGEKGRMRGKSPGTEPLAPPHLNPLPSGERKRDLDILS